MIKTTITLWLLYAQVFNSLLVVWIFSQILIHGQVTLVEPNILWLWMEYITFATIAAGSIYLVYIILRLCKVDLTS